MDGLVLDRISIEDVGVNPRRLAEAIHDQLPGLSGAVPVREIALALDIVEIREERLSTLEAALLTTPERNYGSILLNLSSSRQRRRFSLAHELLHFLNPLHKQTSSEGFQCSHADMRAMVATNDRHMRQEAEANEFAIELLTPRLRLKPFLRTSPHLVTVLRIADEFDVSKEAAARRYVQLHDDCLAVVFTRDRKVMYWDCSKEFPKPMPRRGDVCGIPVLAPGSLSDIEEADAGEWLLHSPDAHLTIQTLGQANGYAVTLFCADVRDEDDNPGFDDAVDRFSRLNP
ncbi:MAG: ImmA/IrrE family metallo-endopeptidase [Xanthobacteraceae bacterium]